jgi:peroxiredoxin Q/BCP
VKTSAAKSPAKKETKATPPATGVAVGAKAPSFALADAAGREVKLSDFAGRWVVIYFYPRADTPGCTKEACEFTERMPAFSKLGCAVLAVSPDTPAALAKFAAKHGLAVTLLADPSKATLERYGAYGEKTMYGRKVTGVLRSTVLVNPQGVIAHHWRNVRAAGHAEAVASRLAELS